MESNTTTQPSAMRNLFYHLVALFVVIVWGVTFVNTRVLVDAGLNPQDVFLLRFTIAYICIWFISPRKVFCGNWKDEVMMLMLGVLGGSLYFITENYAVKLTYVNDVSFIANTSPLLTVIIALMFSKKVKFSWMLAIGSIMALIGLGFVIFKDHFELNIKSLGDLLALAAAISWAFYSLLIKKAADRYSSVFITRKVFIYGVLTTLPMYLVEPWTFPLKDFLNPNVWGNLIFLGLIASFVCFALWSWVVTKLGALKTANYIYLSPIATVVASYFILGEEMVLMSYIGSALILGGVFIANQAKNVDY
ncbi:DMT family transporter [Prevotella corporis]|uniref:Putative membrane protein n=2 Tax=Prevotella corporis TaxID=28128 RepID=A0A133QCZ7_9BACT|nr:putative membrane protein [Prevotella corporis]MDQ7737590.1 DMT family transporter [Prevotella corporis]